MNPPPDAPMLPPEIAPDKGCRIHPRGLHYWIPVEGKGSVCEWCHEIHFSPAVPAQGGDRQAIERNKNVLRKFTDACNAQNPQPPAADSLRETPRTDALWARNRGSESLLEHARTLERELIAAKQESERLEWQPIETAPRGGTRIWLIEGHDQFQGYHFQYGNDEWDSYWTSEECDSPRKPTHWQPLPDAPGDKQ